MNYDIERVGDGNLERVCECPTLFVLNIPPLLYLCLYLASLHQKVLYIIVWERCPCNMMH
jgi:hypothetical protein